MHIEVFDSTLKEQKQKLSALIEGMPREKLLAVETAACCDADLACPCHWHYVTVVWTD